MLVVAMTSLALAGCGSSSRASTTNDTSARSNSTTSASCPADNTKSFAKTKFVLHTGLAFGAFHRYLYKPFKAGTFKNGAVGRLRSFIEGGLAALFVKREIRIASEDVKANPTLCKLLAKPLAKFGDLMGGLVNNLKAGDITSIGAAEETLNTITSLAGGKGINIQEDTNATLNG